MSDTLGLLRQLKPSAGWMVPLRYFQAALLFFMVVAAASPLYAGNFLVAFFSRQLMASPGQVLNWVVENWMGLAGVTSLFLLDFFLIFYLFVVGKKLRQDSILLNGFYGPWHLKFFSHLAGAVLLGLFLLVFIAFSIPLLTLVLAEPLGWLRVCLLLFLVKAILNPGQFGKFERWSWLLLAMAHSAHLGQLDFGWEPHMGVFILSGLLVLVGLKVSWFSANTPVPESLLKKLALGSVVLWLLLVVMSRDIFSTSLGLILCFPVYWLCARSKEGFHLKQCWRAMVLLALGPPLWHGVRTHPPEKKEKLISYGAPGEGAFVVFSSTRGSLGGISDLMGNIWIRSYLTPQLRFSADLPRQFIPQTANFLGEETVGVTGGAMVGVSKSDNQAIYTALNEVLIYRVGEGLGFKERVRLYECDHIGGVVPWRDNLAWVLCQRPHGIAQLDTRRGHLSPLMRLDGGNRPGSQMVMAGEHLWVSEGSMGNGVWAYRPRKSDNSPGKSTAPQLAFFPSGPVGSFCEPEEGSQVWWWSTPYGTLFQGSSLRGKAAVLTLSPRVGVSVWRPAFCGRSAGGVRVFESPFSRVVRGFQPWGESLLEKQELDVHLPIGVMGLSQGRNQLWIGTARQVYKVPLVK